MRGRFLLMLIVATAGQELTISAAETYSDQKCCEELQALKIMGHTDRVTAGIDRGNGLDTSPPICSRDISFRPRTVLGSSDADCLQDDCTSALDDMRTSHASNTSCRLSTSDTCRHFVQLQYDNWRVRDDVSSSDRQAVADRMLLVMEAVTWRNCIVVYDIDSTQAVDKLTQFLSERKIRFLAYDVTDWQESSRFAALVTDVLGRLQVRNVLLLANITTVEMVFAQAAAYDEHLGRTSGLEMLTQWIVGVSGPTEVLDRLHRAARGFDNVVFVSETTVNLVASVEASLDEVMQCNMYETKSLLYKSTEGTVSREFQPVTELTATNDVTISNPFPNAGFFFNGRTLTVGTKRLPPLLDSPSADAGESEFSGLCIDLLRELSRVLNFTFELKLPNWQEGWGSENVSGSWNGLVGLVNRKEVDLVVAPLSFTPDRSLAMESTVPYYHNNLAAVFKKRDPLLDKWRIYFRPFRGEVFMWLGVALMVETFLMHMLAWFDPAAYASQDHKNQHRIFPGPSPDDGFWHMFGVLLSQGGSTLPESCSGRILQAAWMLFSIVIGATYSGNLVAFLTVELEQKPFQTLEELLHQDVYTWGTFANASVYTMLKESRGPVYNALGQRLDLFAASDPLVLSLNVTEQQNKVIEGNFAFLVESSTAVAWTRENCDFSSVIDEDVSFPYGVYLPKGSDYTDIFNAYTLRISEAGLASRWTENMLADSNLCTKNTVSENPYITVIDVQSVLYAGLVGLALALVALAVEWTVHKSPRLRTWTKQAADGFVDGFQKRQVNDCDDNLSKNSQASQPDGTEPHNSFGYATGSTETHRELDAHAQLSGRRSSSISADDETTTTGATSSVGDISLSDDQDDKSSEEGLSRLPNTNQQLGKKRKRHHQNSVKGKKTQKAVIRDSHPVNITPQKVVLERDAVVNEERGEGR